MGSNTFGKIFTITTWGESYGPAMGVVIDGCPAGIELCEEDINKELELRCPGKSAYTSKRKEADKVQILSGIFENRTTGTPISIIIKNQAKDFSSYEPIKDLLRPGHANFCYEKKYGIYDYRGSGRASARETVSRVAAGAVAKKFLLSFNIKVCGYIQKIGKITLEKINLNTFDDIFSASRKSPVFCPDKNIENKMIEEIKNALLEKDSMGGVVRLISTPLPIGLGDPVYQKLSANLANAMLSINAAKGFEIGNGFSSTELTGNQNNDEYIFTNDKKIKTKTNNAGGILGGISNGMPLDIKVAFKPTPSVFLEQNTIDFQGNKKTLQLPPNAHHDPCVALRAVPVVEAMSALVLADSLLLNRCCR